jgi:L-threonylcarbamoyladenylate synthase
MRLYSFDELEQIVFELRNGKAAIVETDTVMGIICKEAELIYKIKHRPHSKKLITFVADINDVPKLSPVEHKILEQY